MSENNKPTKEDLLRARDNEVKDVIAPSLRVLFCGINPSLYSAAVGHHFARPGNRFWPTLYLSGFTDRLLHPSEDEELIKRGLGVTNVVARATARADEVSPEEFVAGGKKLRAKVRRYRPRAIAVLGVTAYRTAFSRPDAVIGRQNENLAGALLWVLPNPSGLNAHYQLNDLANLFRELRLAV
jgi:double-stranded uracil-DNA glycosylase